LLHNSFQARGFAVGGGVEPPDRPQQVAAMTQAQPFGDPPVRDRDPFAQPPSQGLLPGVVLSKAPHHFPRHPERGQRPRHMRCGRVLVMPPIAPSSRPSILSRNSSDPRHQPRRTSRHSVTGLDSNTSIRDWVKRGPGPAPSVRPRRPSAPLARRLAGLPALGPGAVSLPPPIAKIGFKELFAMQALDLCASIHRLAPGKPPNQEENATAFPEENHPATRPRRRRRRTKKKSWAGKPGEEHPLPQSEIQTAQSIRFSSRR